MIRDTVEYVVCIFSDRRKRMRIQVSAAGRDGRLALPKHRFQIQKLVYYEKFVSRKLAVRRQRQVERLVHKKRAELIESVNPEWLDVSGFI
jgi:predicted GIY-YIG superfamily endonuclease